MPPSFNDVRLVLNTAQVMSLVRNGPLELVTFDGDVTLYDDGKNLEPDNPIIPKILGLMRRGSKIGIVTAAGYTEAKPYYGRLHGLLDAIQASDLPREARQNLLIMGGESNFCFKFDENSPVLLRLVPRAEWLLEEMLLWHETDIKDLLDLAEASLRDTIRNFRMEANVVRKERAVGIVPKPGYKFCRETLEETVLIIQKILVCVLGTGAAGCADTSRKFPRLANGCRFARSMVSCKARPWAIWGEDICVLTRKQAETTCLLTLGTSHGECWRVSASLGGLQAARHCMWATSFLVREQMTSRRDWRALQHGLPTRWKRASCWMRLRSWTRFTSARRDEGGGMSEKRVHVCTMYVQPKVACWRHRRWHGRGGRAITSARRERANQR